MDGIEACKDNEKTSIDIGKGIPTGQLLEHERSEALREALSHRARIGKMALEIEKLLIANNYTWGEWEDVMKLIGSRTMESLPKLTIKEIKELYVRFEPGSRTPTDGGGEEKAG